MWDDISGGCAFIFGIIIGGLFLILIVLLFLSFFAFLNWTADWIGLVLPHWAPDALKGGKAG